MYVTRIEPGRETALQSSILCLADFENAARRRLPRPVFHYVAGTAEDGAAQQRNAQSFRDIGFVPRVLEDVSGRVNRTELFGKVYASPFGIAPMGSAGIVCANCDVMFARSAQRAGIPSILSGASLTRLEDVREAGSTSWFQAYVPGDRQRILPLLERVSAAGYATLVVTVDTPVAGNHQEAMRQGFRSPVVPTLDLLAQILRHPRWMWRILLPNLRAASALHFENMDAGRGPAVFSRTLIRDIGPRDALTWEHIEMVRRHWKGTLVLKGVMSAQDAVKAEAAGIDGIIVSNHGGRQLDSAASALDALQRIRERASKLVLMMDGSVRRGSDVLKAIRLGASFVFVGRPLLFAAAVAQEAGIDHAISLLDAEIRRDMALIGISGVGDIADVEVVHRTLR